ncbi:helix-turn-helix transcriptional regulator, partial [Streptomyces tendae]
MTDQPQPLFSAVDGLLAAVDGGGVLPALEERVRLREAAGLTKAAVAQALGVRVASIEAWGAGRAEPKAERLEAYRRLLEGLSRRFLVFVVPWGGSGALLGPGSGAAPL